MQVRDLLELHEEALKLHEDFDQPRISMNASHL
jgi:hypothetical protein